MKAVLVTEFGGTEFLKYEEVNIPAIEKSEVLIRVVKTSVNFADIKSRYGNKGAKLPFIPGLDAAGYVEKIGSNVSRLREGQRVIAFPEKNKEDETAFIKRNC